MCVLQIYVSTLIGFTDGEKEGINMIWWACTCEKEAMIAICPVDHC